MRIREPFEWPADKARLRRRAIVLEWATIGAMASVILVMGLVMGSSQAMRTAWFEDILGPIPAIAFLIAARLERRPPNENFPLGYYRSMSIAYLVGATATLIVGSALLIENVVTLVSRDRPTIGLVTVFGHDLWMGWLMIAALVYSMLLPVILGHLKMPIAHEIHDKVLIADAAMLKADWMTAAAAIVGVLGIGFGLWWADAAAAAFIAVEIVRDGVKHVWRAMRDLADQMPRTVDRAEPHPAIEAARRGALSVDWVEDVEVELREEGHVITGTVFVEPRPGVDVLNRLDEVKEAVCAADWRLYDPVIALVPGRHRGTR